MITASQTLLGPIALERPAGDYLGIGIGNSLVSLLSSDNLKCVTVHIYQCLFSSSILYSWELFSNLKTMKTSLADGGIVIQHPSLAVLSS